MAQRRVLEVGCDGAFDVDAAGGAVDVQVSEMYREKGNAAFQSRAFALAATYYTQAIDTNPHNHLLFSNRSAAYYQLQQVDKALHDADETIRLAPKWAKAYARKAAACEALGLWRDALDAYDRIVSLEKASPEAKKAAAKIQQIQRRLSPTKSDDRAKVGVVQKGFFHKPQAKAKASIYAEKEDVIRPVVDAASGATRLENDDERRWRYMLSRLKGGCNTRGVNASGEKVVLDDGVFAKLLQQREFQALVYPGIPSEQLAHAPKNLQELLEDPWYEEELLSLMPKVQAKAESVLANVKRKGAAQGETMDAATERVLRPQVQQEAFGREVLAMVHRVNYKKHVLLANDARTVADPAADEASWDQLPSAFLDALFSKTPLTNDEVAGVAWMDGFLGDDWAPLVRGDAQRMAQNGLLMEAPLHHDTGAGGGGRMRFLEKAECETTYPALAELLAKLHALPFEINAKRPQRATLCAQFAHCTALHHLKGGEQQRLRLDCGAGDEDNGFKLSCVYFLSGGGSSRTTGDCALRLRTELEEDARVQTVAPAADRLVMFQSQRVLNEITQVAEQQDDEELVYVSFWIHGRELK